MNGLFVVPADYQSLVNKGVAEKLLERDEDGFLNTVITVHPFTAADANFELSPNHHLFEYGQPTSSEWRILSLLKFFLHLMRVIINISILTLRHKIDFIRAQDPYYTGLTGYLASCLTGRPFLISLHADYDKMYELDGTNGAPCIFGSRQHAVKLEKFLLQKADYVLPITEYMASYAQRKGVKADRIRVFRHRVNLEQYRCQPMPKGVPLISLVSRLTRQKHILDIIPLACALRDRKVDFCLEVAGDGECRDMLEEVIQNKELQSQVTLLGFQDKKQLADLLKRSRVSLILTGGASLIEAGAACRPVVAYDCEWHSELVEDGVSGFLVAVHDISAMVNALDSILDDRNLAHVMGKELHRRVVHMYDKKRLLTEHRNIYSSLTQC